jgi:hypothetical protein
MTIHPWVRRWLPGPVGAVVSGASTGQSATSTQNPMKLDFDIFNAYHEAGRCPRIVQVARVPLGCLAKAEATGRSPNHAASLLAARRWVHGREIGLP